MKVEVEIKKLKQRITLLEKEIEKRGKLGAPDHKAQEIIELFDKFLPCNPEKIIRKAQKLDIHKATVYRVKTKEGIIAVDGKWVRQ